MKHNEVNSILTSARNIGLGITSLHVLSIITCGAESLSVLAEKSGVSTAAMTGCADTLAKLGLAVRVNHAGDRRSVYLEPTEAGKKVMAQILNPEA